MFSAVAPPLLYLLLLLLCGKSFIIKSVCYRSVQLSGSATVNELPQQQGRVTIYKKNGCPHCLNVIDLLENKYDLKIIHIDIESEQRDEILQQMRTFSGGRNTVPQVFFNSDHLGGNDDVQKLHAEGRLVTLIEIVRKTPVSMMMDHWFHPWY